MQSITWNTYGLQHRDPFLKNTKEPLPVQFAKSISITQVFLHFSSSPGALSRFQVGNLLFLGGHTHSAWSFILPLKMAKILCIAKKHFSIQFYM